MSSMRIPESCGHFRFGIGTEFSGGDRDCKEETLKGMCTGHRCPEQVAENDMPLNVIFKGCRDSPLYFEKT